MSDPTYINQGRAGRALVAFMQRADPAIAGLLGESSDVRLTLEALAELIRRMIAPDCPPLAFIDAVEGVKMEMLSCIGIANGLRAMWVEAEKAKTWKNAVEIGKPPPLAVVKT